MLAGCYTNLEIDEAAQEKCVEEISDLRDSCDRQDGTFKKTVDEVRGCFGERVTIICSDPGAFEPKILYIGQK